MQLDFSMIENISLDLPIADQIESSNRELNKGLVNIQRKQEKFLQAQNVYKEYQENIKKSELLRAEINKAAKEEAAPEILLLKAIEVIYLLTGDKAILNNIKSHYK